MSQDMVHFKIRGDYRPMDIRVGFRVHLRRTLLHISETDLAALLNIEPRQIVNFERGKEPISSSLLYHISIILETPVENFFRDFSNEFDLLSMPGRVRFEPQAISQVGRDQDEMRRDQYENIFDGDEISLLVRSYNLISDKSVKQQMRDLMSLLAHEDQIGLK